MRFIIVGAGNVGVALCEQLSVAGHDVVLIERREEKIAEIPGGLDVQVIVGNGCDPDVLLQAGIRRANYLVAVADIDEINIAACLSARLLHPEAKRVARLRSVKFSHPEIPEERIAEYFDLIINPDQAGAEYLLSVFHIPGAKEIVEFANGIVRLIGLSVTPHSPILNKKLSALRDTSMDDPLVIAAIIRGSRVIIPGGNDRVRVGDIIYGIVSPSQTANLFRLAGRDLAEGRSAMIWGGSELARILGHALEKEGTKVKLLLSNTQEAAAMVEEFHGALVLKGEGTDQGLLLEESIEDMDAFIAASSDEEDNVLAALLAKRLGAKTVMTLVSKTSYIPLVTTIGVDVVVSSRVAAATAIFRHIHQGAFVSQFGLHQQGVGCVEYLVGEDSPIAGRQLADIELPSGCLVGAIIREEEALTPQGRSIFQRGDKLIILVTKAAVRKLEKLLSIKFEFAS